MTGLRNSKKGYKSSRRTFQKTAALVCVACVTLCAVVLASRLIVDAASNDLVDQAHHDGTMNQLMPTSHNLRLNGKPNITVDDSPQMQVMNQLLKKSRNMSFDQLRDLRETSNYLTEFSFDPLTAKHFDHIKTKLKLTEQEIQLYRKNGFVSVDHNQRYSFGSAYYQIYSGHLPVFVTSDSILHALHRSFDDLLAELEVSEILPRLKSILKATHDSLGGMEQSNQLAENFQDVDLYLCVARNLLASSPVSHLQNMNRGPEFTVPSKFGQDAKVKAVLKSIAAGKVQVPGYDQTLIYGGERPIDYSQFKPRGHYTKSEQLRSYFRCMMWLSRSDCGWFIQPVDPVTKIKNDPIRELKNSCLLAISMRDAGQNANFSAINRVLSHFASQEDNLSADTLNALLVQHRIRDITDLNDDQRLANVFAQIGEQGLGVQLIRSQAIFADNVPHTVKPPSVFQLFGQKFVIDSFVLSNVVYDSIVFENRKIKRFMPTGLDVMAALGNDEAFKLLEPEIRNYNYASNLWSATQFVESCSPGFWQRDAYNIWLDSIRELDQDVTDHPNMPEVMKAEAWQRKQLQTQLASWAELRHDMVLYAKQSYTAVPGCEYPDGYVEPYPSFYRKLRCFAEKLRDSLLDIHKTSNREVIMQQLQTGLAPNKLKEKRITWVARTIEILTELEAIAEAELQKKELTDEQVKFIQYTIDARGSLPLGSGTIPRFDGWYCDLFYNRDDARMWEPSVIDVHTFPSPFGKPIVLEVGVGNVNLGVIAVDCDGSATAYVAPLYSYYEFEHPANDRLTDQQWAQMLLETESSSSPLQRSGQNKQNMTLRELPKRPEWTSVFQADAKSRTVDKVSVNVFNNSIRLTYASDNKKPQTKSFPATDEGVAEFVTFVTKEKFSNRWSLNFSGAKITGNALDALGQLDHLVFLSLPASLNSDDAVKQFRANKPDIEVWPYELRFIRGEICESVSGYQTSVPLRNKTVAAGDSFAVYVEVKGAHAKRDYTSKKYSTNLTMNVRLIDEEGREIQKYDFSYPNESQNPVPQLMYKWAKVRIPEGTPPGDYKLDVQITDLVHPNKTKVSKKFPLIVGQSNPSK